MSVYINQLEQEPIVLVHTEPPLKPVGEAHDAARYLHACHTHLDQLHVVFNWRHSSPGMGRFVMEMVDALPFSGDRMVFHLVGDPHFIRSMGQVLQRRGIACSLSPSLDETLARLRQRGT